MIHLLIYNCSFHNKFRKKLESKKAEQKRIEEYLELAKAAVKKLDKYIKDFRTSYEQQFDPEQGNVEEEEHLEAVGTKK